MGDSSKSKSPYGRLNLWRNISSAVTGNNAQPDSRTHHMPTISRSYSCVSSSTIDLLGSLPLDMLEFYQEIVRSSPYKAHNMTQNRGGILGTPSRAQKPNAVAFNGLRVRMGVHTAHTDAIKRHAVTNRVIYDDALVKQAKLVSETGCGGQVVLTSETIAEVVSGTAAYGCILHMGCHMLSDDAARTVTPASVAVGIDNGSYLSAQQMEAAIRASEGGFSRLNGTRARENCAELFMLVPYALLPRIFTCPQLSTESLLSGGYFDAPGKDKVTICFTAIHGLDGLVAEVSEESSHLAMQMICECVRSRLPQFDGYECEEHKGSFMLAFHSPRKAAEWATTVQEALLGLPWPEDILTLPSCETWQMDNQVTFNGPRFKIAFSSGSVVKKTPNPSTGRADYFGPLLNHTARILSKAAGGQVLVDSPTWEHINRKLKKDHALMAVGLGEFELKGVERPVCLYQVSNEESAVSLRSFPVTRRSTEGSEGADASIAPSARPSARSSVDHSAAGSATNSARASYVGLSSQSDKPLSRAPHLSSSLPNALSLIRKSVRRRCSSGNLALGGWLAQQPSERCQSRGESSSSPSPAPRRTARRSQSAANIHDRTLAPYPE